MYKNSSKINKNKTNGKTAKHQNGKSLLPFDCICLDFRKQRTVLSKAISEFSQAWRACRGGLFSARSNYH